MTKRRFFLVPVLLVLASVFAGYGSAVFAQNKVTIGSMGYPTDSTTLDFGSRLSNNAELENLKYMTKLLTLVISDNELTDISVLKDLTTLQELNIRQNNLTDISALAGLKNLKKLDARQNELTDISALSGLTNLEYLNLDNNKISDLTPLKNLTNLSEINLSINQFTDISVLKGLTNLKTIRIEGNKITFEQVTELAVLPNLTFISTGGSSFWPADFNAQQPIRDKLQKAFPNAGVN